MSEQAELIIAVGVGEEDSDSLNLSLKGTPNQALGFIARARVELDKMERSIISDISKP